MVILQYDSTSYNKVFMLLILSGGPYRITNRVKHLYQIKAGTYTDCRFVRFPIPGDRVPDKLWLGSPLQQKREAFK